MGAPDLSRYLWPDVDLGRLPTIGAGVDPDWQANGLVALFDCRQARELISGDFATNRSSLPLLSKHGLAADFSGTANQQYKHRPAYALTGPMSIVVFCDVDTLTNYGALVAKQGTTTANIPYELRIGVTSTDSWIALIRASASSGALNATGTGNNIAAGATSVVVAATASSIYADGPRTLYVNGASVAGANSGTTYPVTDTGSSAVWIGRRYDGATQLDGRIYYVALFNRALSPQEIESVSSNPAQFFAPPLSIPLMVASGGGGSNTVNATAGAWSWSGTTAGLYALTSASPGAWSYVGTTASLTQLIAASPGAWSWAGTSAGFSNLLAASPGQWNWAGTTATLAGPLNATPGTWSFAGTAASLSQLIAATPGAASWAGTTATTTQLLAASAASYSWAGTAGAIVQQVLINAAPASYSWVGTTAVLPLNATQAGGWIPEWNKKQRRKIAVKDENGRFQVFTDRAAAEALFAKEALAQPKVKTSELLPVAQAVAAAVELSKSSRAQALDLAADEEEELMLLMSLH